LENVIHHDTIWRLSSACLFALRLLKVRILLKADVSEAREGWSDNQIIDALATSASMVYRGPEIIAYQGALFDLMGDYETATRTYTRALSLSPHSPAWIAANLGLSYLALGNNEEAERIYGEVIQHYSNYARAWIGLTVALVRQGKMKEAKHRADTLLSLDPHFTSAEWGRSRPFNDEQLLAAFIADLKSAGLP
jgi:tetratricopeptide (TPR) repeat protein